MAAVRRRVLDVETEQGLARAHVSRPPHAGGTLVIGHGAGGGIDVPALVQAGEAALAAGWAVAWVEQPWRVAGRRVAVAPPRLDDAWLTVVRTVRTGRSALPGALVLGGHSAGARVACRTASGLGAVGVLALSFPLQPPAGRLSRAPELGLAPGRLLVVQGWRDPFGGPEEIRAALLGGGASPRLQRPRTGVVVGVEGTHALRPGPDLAAAVTGFLRRCQEGGRAGAE